MVNRPSVPEIITVNSEELQTQIRDLLPSQAGFGSELQATNVITPIIDLTAAAEGTQLRSDLQTALAFGSQTTFAISNTTSTIVNSPGFYRIFGVSNLSVTGGDDGNEFALTDGLTNKIIWKVRDFNTNTDNITLQFDFIVWLAPGESLSGTAANSANLTGSSRQVAGPTGTLTNPSGYPL